MKNSIPLLFILFIVGVIIAGPIFSIVALNTLFGLTIPITLGTWAAAFWLSIIVSGSSIKSSK